MWLLRKIESDGGFRETDRLKTMSGFVRSMHTIPSPCGAVQCSPFI